MQNNTFSTLFVGQNFIRLTEVDSTNNFLKSLVSNSEPLPEGTVIMADDQYAGRGQQNSVWKSFPGKNLTISILLRPVFLPLNQQFLLNMVISIGVCNALTAVLNQSPVIKWPNDIYFRGKKLGGLLIENTVMGDRIKTTVVGIGINVNQDSFQVELTNKAVSIFQILQKDVNLIKLLAEICSEIESLYLQLRAGNYNKLRQDYVDRLYLLNELATYKAHDQIFEGLITGVSDVGLLQLTKQGEPYEFNFKEIELLNHL